MFRKITGFLLPILLVNQLAFSQKNNISGKILDATNDEPLIGVNVVATNKKDTTQKYGTVTDLDGAFLISDVPDGSFELKASYVGFENFFRNLEISGAADLGTLKMKALSTQLQNVLVTGQQIRAQQSGDTTSFNAGAFKTNPDASAEDLIKKMPGITTEGGTIKANGEEVKQVLVDGKPFFGDDPNAAVKNLPAEIIDRIQVFDKLSDQARLTGFDDGNEQRTINIITKPGKNTGQFGKIFAGYGSRDLELKDNFYSAGGNINFFKGDTRISVIALSNNVNQQNFSPDDLMGVMNASGGGGGRGGGRGGFRGGGGNTGNFLVGQQAGITTTHSAGINYSDNWSEKITVSGSYFFNTSKNENTTSLSRNYFAGADSSIIYKENSLTTSRNTNHRANLRIEYEIDSSNTLIFSPRISFQQNDFTRNLLGESRYPDSSLINSLNNSNQSSGNGYNFSGNLTYRHKFAKRGRTASLSLNGSASNRLGDGTTYSLNRFLNDNLVFDTALLDQRYDLTGYSNSFNGNLTYTEPVGKSGQLMVNYTPSFSKSNSDRESMTRDPANGQEYTIQDTALSNKFENTYNTQRGGLNYRYNNEKFQFSAGLNYQFASLQGMQIYPTAFEVDRNFSDILPMMSFNYRFSKNRNLRIMYRSSTNPPSISQLQNVLDVTNPLLVQTGNADLKQNYNHTLMLRYGNTNTEKATSFFAMLYGSYMQDYIGNETIFPTATIPVAEQVVLSSGSQITRPVNMDGYFSARSFLTYGVPVKTLKSNLNLNIGFNYNRLPGRIRYIDSYDEIFEEADGITNISNNYTINGGLVLSSNISENLDFTLSYSGNYNVVRNTLQARSDNNYYNHNTSLGLNYILLGRLVFNTTANYSLYSGLSEGYNQSFVLWNAGIGYKLLADKSLDLRLNVYDILNQNRSIERTITETYIEDSYTNILRRYFMLNATYTLRRFGDRSSEKSPEEIMPPPPERRRRY